MGGQERPGLVSLGKGTAAQRPPRSGRLRSRALTALPPALLALLSIAPSVQRDVPLPGQVEPRRRVVLLIAADWKGDFGPSEDGYGGLAALAAYARMRRETLAAEGSSLLFVHAGSLTGAKSAEPFAQSLQPGGLDLLAHLKMDAVVPSPEERSLAASLPKRLRRRFIDAHGAPDEGGRLRAYRLLALGERNVLVTGLSLPTSAEPLLAQLRLHSAADIQVLLLSGAPPPGLLARLFSLAAVENPFELLPAQQLPLRVLARPARENAFTRGSAGTLYCHVRPRSVCEIEVTFDGPHLLGLRSRFLEPNGREVPEGTHLPDALLDRTFSPVGAK